MQFPTPLHLPEGACGSGDGGGDKVVEVTVRGGGELEGAEANVVEGLVVESEALVGVLDELVDRESGVVGLDDSVGNLGGRDDRVRGHDPVGVLLANLGDEEGAHAGPGPSSHGVGDLEALHHIAVLSLFADDVHDGVDQFGTLSIVTLGPVVSSSGLYQSARRGRTLLARVCGGVRDWACLLLLCYCTP